MNVKGIYQMSHVDTFASLFLNDWQLTHFDRVVVVFGSNKLKKKGIRDNINFKAADNTNIFFQYVYSTYAYKIVF